jgi:hypothetical protein
MARNRYLPQEYIMTVYQDYITLYCGTFRAGWGIAGNNGMDTDNGNVGWQIGYEAYDSRFCFLRGMAWQQSCGLPQEK